jgi:CRISPR-associated exonuclease Cas4
VAAEDRNDISVRVGVIFAGKDRRRHEVLIDDGLMNKVRVTTEAVRTLLEHNHLPEGVRDTRCRRCSLRPGCLPDAPQNTEALFVPRPEGDWHD